MAANVPETIRASSFSDNHATYLQKQEYVYTWKIHSFREWLAEVGAKCQYSPSFPEVPATYEWSLHFHPEKKVGDIAYCAVYLVLLKGPTNVNVRHEVTMSDDEKNEIRKLSGCRRFTPKEKSWGWPKYFSREKLLEQLKNNVLVISCKIQITSNIVNERNAIEVPAVGINLSNDLETLLAEGKFGDAAVTVGRKKFLVYKGILAARSPVFAAMFEHNMVENTQNKVEIEDIPADVFAQLLRYIYTDKIDKLDGFAHQLFAAADKYCILPLKAQCQQFILANLSVQNAAKTLQLADEHHAAEMKTHVLLFLSSGAAGDVTDTADWKSLARNCPHLVDEVIKTMAR